MLNWLKQRRDFKRAGEAIYRATVAQARHPIFFVEWSVSDTVEGRFAMVSEHLALVLARLGREGAAGQALAEAITAAFVVDMDDAMRKVGIGDMAVPRKVKKAAAALYDRHRAHQARIEAAAAGQGAREAWIGNLRQHFAQDAKSPDFDATRFDDYAGRLEAALSVQSFAALSAGEITFAPPQGP